LLKNDMFSRSESYCRHIPTASSFEGWGLIVTAAGYAQIAPGAPYPPAIYPEDHLLRTEVGSVIDHFQLVAITEGKGYVELGGAPRRQVCAGDAFLVLPGVRHRFGPDAKAGWGEAWVEFHGTTADALLAQGVLSPETAICAGRDCSPLRDAMDALFDRLDSAVPSYDPMLSAKLLAVLAAWAAVVQRTTAGDNAAQALVQAERYLSAHLTEPVNMEALAAELGVPYSHFRRAFKERTGFSPWQYVLQLRLMRARRLLCHSEATLDEVAAGLGFNSAFHLSVTFKQAFGVSPDRWRKSLDRPSPTPRP
jgi:AraC-like DNA-binding protein